MSMKLSGKKLTTAILAGLMGATMFGGSVFAEVSDQEFIEVRQGVNSNKARISQLENAQSTAKDYSTDIAANKKAIGDEAAARESGDNALYNQINKESANQNVTSESDLIKKDQSVGQNLTNVDTALHKEIAARIGADKAQDKVIQTVNSNLANSVDTINRNVAEGFAALNATDQTIAGNVDLISNNQNVTSESDLIKKDQSVGQNLTNVDTALHKEIAARIGADKEQDEVIKGVNDNLVSSVDTINKNIGTITDQLNKNDLAEAKARDAADQKLQGNIDAEANARDVADQAEANARDVADQKLQGNIDAEANARDVADQAETKVRADKDTEHDTAIAANKKAIGDEAAARESGDNALQNQFKKESAARQADISRLDNKIHDVSKEVDTVGALSMAMSGLHPLSYDEGDARFQLSAAVGTYDGTEALALGGFYHFNRDSMLSVGVATDLGADEHRMGANVGYTRRIGQGGHVSRPSEGTVSDIMKDIKNLEQKQAKMEQENEQLKQQLAALKK